MQPDQPRPYSCWGYPLTPLLVGAISVGFLGGSLISETKNSFLALSLVVGIGMLGEIGSKIFDQQIKQT